jgi:hypothetical protein
MSGKRQTTLCHKPLDNHINMMPELMMLLMVAKRNPLKQSVEMNIQIVGKSFTRIFKAKEELWKFSNISQCKNIIFKKILIKKKPKSFKILL